VPSFATLLFSRQDVPLSVLAYPTARYPGAARTSVITKTLSWRPGPADATRRQIENRTQTGVATES
jgi:hypothetical protein